LLEPHREESILGRGKRVICVVMSVRNFVSLWWSFLSRVVIPLLFVTPSAGAHSDALFEWFGTEIDELKARYPDRVKEQRGPSEPFRADQLAAVIGCIGFESKIKTR